MRFISFALIFTVLWVGAAYCEPVLKSDTISSPEGFGKPHGSSMVELENGDILATWFSAGKETDSGAMIFGAEWKKKTGAWTKPRVIIPSDYSKSVGNTALFKDDDKVIWLFFAAVAVGGWSGSMVDYVTSSDDGKTWSEGETLVWRLGNLPRNPPIKIGDHTMLVPLFTDFMYEINMVGSYTARLKYSNGKILEEKIARLDDYDAIQPTVVKLPDGRILLLARDKSDRFIRRSYSTDNGSSWASATITDLPNPGSAISAIFIDEIGAVLLAYNHSRIGRNPLSLAISTDGGMTFRRITDLESKPGDKDASFSYPTIIRTKDRMLHLIWSHDKRATLKHIWFDLDWLIERIKDGAGVKHQIK